MLTFVIFSLALQFNLLMPGHSASLDEECPVESGYPYSFVCETWVNDKNYTDKECLEKVINARSVYDPEKQSILSALTAQYCRGTDRYEECSVCFRDVFKYQWNQHGCLEQLFHGIPQLNDCVEQYENSQFTLTMGYFRKIYSGLNEQQSIITFPDFPDEKENEYEPRRKEQPTPQPSRPKLDVTMQVTVNLSADGYKDCLGIFPADILTEDNQFVFNVYKDSSPQGNEFIIIEGYLSLFLDAVRIKNESSFDRVKCRDILHFHLLSRYRELATERIKSVPKLVKASFRNLRRDYCLQKTDRKGCMKCFEPADELFVHYLYNNNKPIHTVRKDFAAIQNILTDCFRNVSSHYPSQQSLTESYYELAKTWDLDFGECWGDFKGIYGRVFKTNKEIISLCEHNNPILKTVATYYFGFHTFMKNSKPFLNRECYDIQHSRILCAAGETVKFFTEFGEDIEYEQDNDILKYLVKQISSCGERIKVT